MHPIAFEIGSLSIGWYGIMAAFGFLAGSWLLDKNRKFAQMSNDQCATLLIIALVCGVFGARIFYVVEEFDQYRDNLLRVFRIDQGGLVFYGGFILALTAVIIYTRKHKLNTIRVLDVLAPVMALAHGFGRIGCFLFGCCYGKKTGTFFDVTPPVGSKLAQATKGWDFFPTQLLETVENFLLCILLCWMLRKTKRPGIVMSLYFIIYGTLRFLNEFLRADNKIYWIFTPAQWIGLLMVPAGFVLLLIFTRCKCDEKH